MANQPQVIESTAGQIAMELARRGIAPQQRVTVTIEPPPTDAEKLTSLKALVRDRLDGAASGNVVDADTFFAGLRARARDI